MTKEERIKKKRKLYSERIVLHIERMAKFAKDSNWSGMISERALYVVDMHEIRGMSFLDGGVVQSEGQIEMVTPREMVLNSEQIKNLSKSMKTSIKESVLEYDYDDHPLFSCGDREDEEDPDSTLFNCDH